ncbi:hypothetical protein BAE44_0003865 [Dichanthelium oligosanthes]|uniref:At1g61320/AtMIF1 LRR domain-containing protein n=1 Tax=Dichanthelium oligosanthes TaxID=888268 RepID=A0A1E5WCJ4_9POAL|nr:hypothetical protein BAE44_0003865 [Dichanthelium oligosanthes]
MYTLGLLELDTPPFDIQQESPIIEDQMRRGVVATFEEYIEKNDPMTKEFVTRVDRIMHNHIGTGIKTFRLQPPHGSYIDPAVLDRWFEAVIAQGIRKFVLHLDMGDDGLGYNFPCSLLSSKKGPSTITSFAINCRLRSPFPGHGGLLEKLE